MALAGNYLLPKPTMLSMHNMPKLQKPKTLIVCAKPERPPTSSGRGGQINSTPRILTSTTVGVKEVTPNTTLDAGGDNQKSKTSVDGDAAATVKGAEPTD